jgi:hypothetical protein
MANTELPGRLSQVPFHGPLSEARAARLTDRLTRNGPSTVLDIGRARGLADRVTFVRESGAGTTRGPADLVLSVGATQALSEVQPPGHNAAALSALRGGPA